MKNSVSKSLLSKVISSHFGRQHLDESHLGGKNKPTNSHSKESSFIQ